MDISYRRDLGRNLMVISSDAMVLQENSYVLRMIERSRMTGFLPLTLQSMNGRFELSYDITSLQCFKTTYERKNIRYQELRTLLSDLRAAADETARYLLPSTDIILDPACIYLDITTGRHSFCYLPHYSGRHSRPCMQLSEFILRRLDHNDRAAVELGYLLFEQSSNESFSFSALPLLHDESISAYSDTGKDSHESISDYDTEALFQKDEPQVHENVHPAKAAKYHPGKNKAASKNRQSSRSLLLPGIISGSALLYGLLVWIFSMDLTQMGGLFFLFTALIWLSYGAYLEKKKQSRGIWEGLLPETDAEEEEYYAALAEAEDAAGIQSYGNEVNKTGQTSGAGVVKKEAPADMSASAALSSVTRYLGGTDTVLRPVLISQDVRRCRDLTVETSSARIGKKQEEADLCIPLDVISRVHARIDLDGEEVFLTDENSTNGTFVNGQRLAPMEKRKISPGDLVSFATVHFKLQMRDY